MATQLQLRRGTTSQVAAFTGANGEVVVDTEKKTLFVNDGSTAGGLEIARADFSNISASATLTLATLNATTLNTTNLDLTNLEVTNIKAKDGTSAGSIADSTGVVTIASAVLTTADINAGTFDGVVGGTTPAAGTFTTVSVDNITIDGTEIDLSSGDLTLDVAGEINLDADDGKIRFKDGGTEHLRFVMDNAGVVQLYSAVQDSDIKIQGNDGGSVVDALTFDMSEGGNAVFGKNVSINAAGASTPAPLQAFQVILHSGGGRRGTIYYNANNRIAFAALNASNTWESMEIEASDINFNTGGSSQTTALTLNSSQNAGLGVTPESWNSNFRALQIGPWGSLATTTSGNGESFRVNANFYNDGSAEKYLGTGYALMFKEGVTAGSFVFSSSQASGSADGSIASWYHSEIHNHSWAATLETTTSDGSDTYGVGLDAGGGGGSTARGAGLWVYGNEHGSYPGSLIAQMGESGTFRVHTGASGTERMRIFDNGSVGLGTAWNGTKDSVFKVMGNNSGWLSVYHNDGNGSNRYGIKIGCGSDNQAGTNYAMGFDNGDFTVNQGYITWSSGSVSYGAFTAHHPCVIPDADNDPDSPENAYPYGTLLETISLSYTQLEEADTERGIRYSVQKSSGAYSKKVLGAYGSSMNDAPHNPDNEHQALVLGDGHILCNNEKGNISVGDGICTSSTAGIGMKADKMAMIIGIAQEDVTFSGSETKLVAVQYGLQQFTPWAD